MPNIRDIYNPVNRRSALPSPLGNLRVKGGDKLDFAQRLDKL